MPLESLMNLHRWAKEQAKEQKIRQKTKTLPAPPEMHDLIGFPGVEAEHPKKYIRKLWLAAEHYRTQQPPLYAANAIKLQRRVSEVVNRLKNNEDQRQEELAKPEFLKDVADSILLDEGEGYGHIIWGQDYGAPELLHNKHGGTKPKWRIKNDAGEWEKNDQDQYDTVSILVPTFTNTLRITLHLRQWIAARLQASINAVATINSDRRPSVEEKAAESSASQTELPRPHQLEAKRKLLRLEADHFGDSESSGRVDSADEQLVSETLAAKTSQMATQLHEGLHQSLTTPRPHTPARPTPYMTRSTTTKRIQQSFSHVDHTIVSRHVPHAHTGNERVADLGPAEDEVDSDDLTLVAKSTSVKRTRKHSQVHRSSVGNGLSGSTKQKRSRGETFDISPLPQTPSVPMKRALPPRRARKDRVSALEVPHSTPPNPEGPDPTDPTRLQQDLSTLLTRILKKQNPYTTIVTELHPLVLALYEKSPYHDPAFAFNEEFEECSAAMGCWIELINHLNNNLSPVGYTDSPRLTRTASVNVLETVESMLRARRDQKNLEAWKNEHLRGEDGVEVLTKLSEDLASLFYALIAPAKFNVRTTRDRLRKYNAALLSWYGVKEVA
jgi:hypothetical protein